MLTLRGRFYISMVLGFVLIVAFQNCSNSSGGLNLQGQGLGHTTFDVKVFNSSSKTKTCYEIGQVVNISINTVPSNRKIQYTIRKAGNPNPVGGGTVTSPEYIQQVFDPATNRLGEYTILVETREGYRGSKSITYNVRPMGGCGGTSCELSTSAGTSHSVGQSVPYTIVSQPKGLEAFLEISENNYQQIPVGSSDLTTQFAATGAGTFTRTGYVRDSDGSLVKCTPTLTVTVTPGSTPTPVPTPTATPPPVPSGNISLSSPALEYCPIYYYPMSGYTAPCSATISWTFNNTANAQLFYLEGNAMKFLTCSSTNSSTTMTLDASDIPAGYVTRVFYLFATNDCSPLSNPPTSSAFSVSTPMTWYVEVDPIEACMLNCPYHPNECAIGCYTQYGGY